MNSSSTKEEFTLSRPIADEDVTFSFMISIVSIMGLITNSINVRAFIIVGIKDGVTVTFLAMAISDIGYTTFNLIGSASSIVGAMEIRYDIKNLPVQPRGVMQVFAGNICLIFFQVTCMTTTFLAVARCMCVAMPFKFKCFFTWFRCVVAQAIFASISVTLHAAIFSQMGVQLQFDPMVNKTRYVLWLSTIKADIKVVVSYISLYVFVYISNFVVLVCVLIMAKFLRASVKFRNMASSEKFGKDGKKISTDKLSGKELQVVRQVIVVCIIYSTCTVLPTLIMALMEAIIGPEFGLGKKHNTLLFVGLGFQYLLYTVNSATTFFVYYAYNSKFRSVCFTRAHQVQKT